MPITQNRMLSLLAAAEDYQQAMERIFNIAATTRERVNTGEITPESGYQLLAIEFRPEELLKYPYESPGVLKIERLHFNREARRNERKAEKLRENRLALASNQPRPNRGNGAEFGILGASGVKHTHNTESRPNPGLLIERDQSVRSHTTKTDEKQIQSSTELEFDTINEPDEAAKAGINAFLELEEAKEVYNKLGQESGNKD